MKALVLAAGRGTRLRPITHAIPKQLIPLAGEPILHHVLAKIAQAGLREVGLVVGPETRQPLEEYVGSGARWGLKVEYILQEQPLGLAHAVKVSRDYLGEEDFLMYLGDNLIAGSIRPFLDDFSRRRCDASVILKKVPNPSAFGIAEVDARGQVTRIVEKPAIPPTDLAVIGIYAFSPRIHDAIEGLPRSGRGEYEITDAIMRLKEAGGKVYSHLQTGWWLDTGSVEDLLAANHALLGERESWVNEGAVEGVSRINGRFSCGKGTVLRRVTLKGPVVIGRDCQIEDAVLGPDTCLGDRCQVRKAEVTGSILMAGSRVEGVILNQSLLGNRTRVKGDGRLAMRLVQGDDNNLDIR